MEEGPAPELEQPLEAAPAVAAQEAVPSDPTEKPKLSFSAANKGAKTRITKMEMKGFKSFANKVEIPFGTAYNCIIGPNGSGKSNVLDSLCFVLGKTSAKSMRAEKSANLIYNGGKTKNPAKEGEVAIYFDNTDHAFPLDYPQVKVSRIIKANGNSVYKINDETVTRNQVLETLLGGRVDPDGYNIILQGDIIGLIEMSPDNRRMIIEEISGIGEYEDKRHKAALELEKVDQQLKESDIILAERGTYMKELKKERDQAQKFKDLEEKLKRNKATILQRKVDERKTKEEKLAKQLADEEADQATHQGKIDAFKKEIAEKKQRTNDIGKEIQSKGQKEQLELNKQVEQLRVDIGVSGNRVETLKTELTRLTERKKQLETQQKEIQERIAHIDKDAAEAKQRDDHAQAELAKLQEKVVAFRKKNNLEDASAVDEKIGQLDKEIERLQEDTAKLRQQEQQLLREKDKIEYQLGTIDDRIAHVMELHNKDKAQIQELKQHKEHLPKAQADLKASLESAKALHAEHQRVQEKERKAEEELAKLRSRSIQIREASAGTIAVQKILEQKKHIRGIYGTIAELGSVKEQYSLALEVAAGGRIRSIVVEDDGAGQKCLEYLRENRLGVATFLPLNKVKGTVGTAPKGKGVVGLAIDLVTYDEKYGAAFSYVFGSTVVVEDVTSARALGIGNYRMVTLTGDLFETSGAMTGGYQQRAKGGMGFQEKELTDGLAKLELEVSQLTALEATLQKKRDENAEHIESLRKAIAQHEAEIIKLERILKVDAGDVDVSKEQKEKLQKERKEIEEKLDAVSEKVSEDAKKIGLVKAEKQKLRESLNQLRNPALLAELQTLEQQKTTLENERITTRANLASYKAQKETVHQPELENITRVFKQQAQDEARFAKELETLSAKRKENEVLLKEKEKEAAAFYKQFQELFAERDKLQDAIAKLEGKVGEEDERVRKIEQQKGSINIGLAGVRAELAGLAEEAKQFVGIEPYKTKEQSEMEKEIRDFERMMQDLGAINMKALEIYEAVEKEFAELQTKKGTLNKERETVLTMIAEVDAKKKEQFLRMFAIVSEQFKKIFVQLNSKGEAFLELENPEDPLSAGMNIKVRLSGTKFLDIRSLSGGEKTMTALAFLFAIQEHEPAQFYVLDEVDAALDKRNAEKLAKLIKQYSSKAQYIMISHNDVVINEADNLYGVSMNEHGESKVTSLRV